MQEQVENRTTNHENEETSEKVARDIGRQAAIAEEVSDAAANTITEIDDLLDEIDEDEAYSIENARRTVLNFRQVNGQ